MRKIGILVSYNGSGFDAIYEAIQKQKLDFEIVVVISNNENAVALQKANSYGIEIFLVNSKTSENPDETIKEILKKFDCEYVLLSGYMKKLSSEIINNFKIINCHPSLLPKYGGKGMYGTFVHNAVFENKEKISGCTIHFINENYDDGEIILQKTINIADCENAKEIEERVKKLEKIALIEAFNLLR